MTIKEFFYILKDININTVDFGLVNTYNDNFKFIGIEEGFANIAEGSKSSGYTGVSILVSRDSSHTLLELKLEEKDLIYKIFRTFG